MTSNWYVIMEPALIQTAFVLAIFPYLNFIIFYIIRILKRFLDSRTTCCSRYPKTRVVTISSYVELYSGQDIFMYFKYSNIMVLVFMAFTHGIAFPVLFPISLFGLFNNFLVERVCLAYYYKQPPLLDNKLNLFSLNTLRIAPLCLLCCGYWTLGNR